MSSSYSEDLKFRRTFSKRNKNKKRPIPSKPLKLFTDSDSDSSDEIPILPIIIIDEDETNKDSSNDTFENKSQEKPNLPDVKVVDHIEKPNLADFKVIDHIEKPNLADVKVIDHIEKPQPEPFKERFTRAEYLQNQLSRPSIIYRINRKKSQLIRKKIIFQLFKKNEILYTAKGIGFSSNEFYINKGNEVHLSNPQFDGAFLIDGWGEKNCQLFLGNYPIIKEKILDINIIPGGSNAPRTFRCNFNSNIPKGYPSNLCSKMPKFNANKGTWQLDFLGKFVLKSIKNCILEGHNLERAIIIRKTTKEDIEIEVYYEIDPIYIFGIALGSFLS